MILYCCQHPASILRAVIHKFKYHEYEDAVILGEYPVSSPYYPIIDKISYYQMPSVHNMVTFGYDKISMIEHIQETINNFMTSIGYDFYDFEKIYAIYDMYNPFTIYFETKEIKYMCIESTDNVFNNYWSGNYVEERPEEARCFNSLIKELHTQDGQGQNCLKGFLFSEKSKIPEGGKVPVEVFDYYGTLLSLNENSKQQLIKAYNLDKFSFDSLMMFNSPGWTGFELKKKNIFLTSEQKKNTNENTFVFYKEVLDYYFKDISFVLKLHPASGQDFVTSFSDFEQIPPHIFVELFAVTKRKFRIYCPVQSTGIGIFQKLGFDVTYFSANLIPFFKHINFVYLAFSLINSICQPEQIFTYGIDTKQLDYFKNWSYKDFKSVKIDKLTKDNVKNAKFIIAEPNGEFETVIKECADDCLIIVNGDHKCDSVFIVQNMTYSVIDTSEREQVEIEKSNWTVLSKNEKVLKNARNFCASHTLKNAKVRIQSSPRVDFTEIDDRKKPILKPGEYEKLKSRERGLIKMHRFLQMYYETEHTGYTLKDYFEERGLLSDKVKIAFFAVDELGVLVYRICERSGIHFTAFVSDTDREITCQTHGNLTETLKFKSMDTVNKEDYTTVFMATTWNGEQIDFVQRHCPSLFLFDAVVQAMYTRAFFVNKAAAIKEKNPGVHLGIFFTPYVHQIPGQHSELEEYFRQQGTKMPNILYIQDDAIKEKAKNLCYREYGFDDEYIENVCSAGYPITAQNDVYLMQDSVSKYVNVINHRRVTTDQPNEFSNTVYFFGDSCVTGLHVGDAETIESNFQRMINASGMPYIVHNCANSYGLRYDWIFGLTDTMTFKPGDILLFCSRVDWLTEQYIKQNNKKLLCDILGIYTTPVFQRPHDHGEVFTDDHHCNGKGYGLIAQKIFDDIKAAGFFEKSNGTVEEESKSLNEFSAADNKMGGG